MRRITGGSLVASSVALLALGCSVLAESGANDADRVGTSSAELLNGADAGGASSTSTAIFLDGYARVCTGTLLTPTWVLTSATCAPSDGEHDAWVQADATNQAAPNRVVVHPTLNVALIQLATPFATPASFTARALYDATPASILNKPVTAYGAGNNLTTDAAPDLSETAVREASFTVTGVTPAGDGYTLAGSGGTQLVAGDEGGGTFYSDSYYTYLSGIHVRDGNGNFYDLSAQKFHDWVTEQIEGTATYYPNAFLSMSPDGLVPANTTAHQPWSPCGGGGYTWTATYDLGTDATGSISAGGTTTALAGVAVALPPGGSNPGASLPVSAHGSGTMTIQITTTDSEVEGILDLSAVCDAPSVACANNDCAVNAVTTPKAASGSWQPCGSECFSWGAIGVQSGDAISVGGVSSTASTPGACGSVPVQATYGSSTSARPPVDLWAVCGGCDDQSKTCGAKAPDGHTLCGSHADNCGLSFNCGNPCTGNQVCSGGECLCPTYWTTNADLSCSPPNPCGTNNGGCAANAICTNDATNDGGHTCACELGYAGDGYNSCIRNLCGSGCAAHQTCVLSANIYQCVCDAAYDQWDGACLDKCLDGNSGCPAGDTCTNHETYVTCTDACNNVCSASRHQTCIAATHSCGCLAGYELDGSTCVKLPACPCGGTPGHCKIVCPPL